MILVYLPDSSRLTAIQSASSISRHLETFGKPTCPSCSSTNTFLARKSDSSQRWMEIDYVCGDCPNRFPVPDKFLQGFWRDRKADTGVLVGAKQRETKREKVYVR